MDLDRLSGLLSGSPKALARCNLEVVPRERIEREGDD